MNLALMLCAKNYATAYYNLFHAEITVATYRHFIYAADALDAAHTTLYMLTMPLIPHALKKSTITKILAPHKLPASFAKLIDLIIEKNYIMLLPAIARAIAALFQQKNTIEEFAVQTPIALDQADLSALEQFIQQQLATSVVLHSKLDTSLIAGIRLQSKNHLWERSVAKQLRAIKNLVKQ